MRRLTLLLLLLVGRVFAADTTTTFMWVPARPEHSLSTSFPAANVLRCTRFVAELGITGTQIGWNTPSGGGGGAHCGVALYSEDGTTLVVTSGAVDCSGSGNKRTSGLSPFTLVAGTAYQECVCSDAGGGAYLTINATGRLTDMQNALSVPLGTTAATACTAGAPPTSTGVLTAGTAPAPIILLGTNTP